MAEIQDIQACNCGAITVYFDNGSSCSMTEETALKKLNVSEVKTTLNPVYSCNHCVNRWGVDLCGCGSGEPVGECDGGFHECKNNQPSQEWAVEKPFLGWV